MTNDFLKQIPPLEINWATYKPASMPPPVLQIYLSLPVEKREEALYHWLRIQAGEDVGYNVTIKL